MISEEIKDLVSKIGGTLVIVENNQPKFVVMAFDKFLAVIAATSSSGVIHKNIDKSGNFDKDNSETFSVSGYRHERDEEIIDRLNNEILALKEQVAEKEKEFSNLSERSVSEHSDKL
ncbi:MAG: hypothetical protein AAB627_00580 [Patescibacteria group bacterium]